VSRANHITDRMIVKIILRHKDKILNSQEDSQRLQGAINRVIKRFAARTGKEIHKVEVEEHDGKYELKIRMEC